MQWLQKNELKDSDENRTKIINMNEEKELEIAILKRSENLESQVDDTQQQGLCEVYHAYHPLVKVQSLYNDLR